MLAAEEGPTQADGAGQHEDLLIDVMEAPLPPLPPSTRSPGRMPLSRRLWGRGVFTAPFLGPSPPEEDEDVAMPTVSPFDAEPTWRVLATPPMSTPPMLREGTRKALLVFARAYDEYCRSLAANVTQNSEPHRVPVGACIEERLGREICLYELKIDPRLVTEEHWVNYIKGTIESLHKDYAVVDSDMRRLRMDLTIPDAKSRMRKLRSDMHKILDDHNVESIMLEKEQKKLVNYLAAGLGPDDFREAIKTRLTYDENKMYRSNVVEFYGWVVELLDSYMLWQPPRRQQAPQTPQGQRGRGQNPRPAPAPAGTPPASGNAPPSRPPPTSRPPLTCLRCGQTGHRVRDCEGIQPGEAERLLAAYKASKKAGGANVKRLTTPEGTQGTVEVVLEDTLSVQALLDTGADYSVVSGGVISELQKRGAFVAVREMETPTVLRPVGDATIKVTRKVRFGTVKLHTSAGPLILRNLECWIYDADETSTIIIGRPVMVMLGYSTDGLLTNARDQCAEGQLDGGVHTPEDTPMVKLQVLSTKALDDQLDQDCNGPLPRYRHLRLRKLEPSLRVDSLFDERHAWQKTN